MTERKRPKLSLNAKKFFADYDHRFEKQVAELLRKHRLRDDLTKALMEMGEALDKDLYKHSAIKKEAYERLSYKQRAVRYATKLFSETSREAVMIKKADAGGVPTEYMIAELLFGRSDKYKVDGDVLIRINDKRVVTADTWDTLDVLAHNITELWMDDVRRSGELPVRQEFTIEELQALAKSDMFVIVSWEKYKRLLGKSGSWDRKQCEAAVLTLKNLNYSGTLRFPTKDHGLVGFKVADSFAGIYIPEDEKSWDWVRDSAQYRTQARALEAGGGFIINFTGRIWGMLFFLNVLNREVGMLPKRFYTDLTAREKLLFRLTRTQRKGAVSREQIMMIMGLKEKVSEEGQRLRMIEIQKTWAGLKTKGFIKAVPEPVEETGTIRWHYEHSKEWFSDPKTLGEISAHPSKAV